MNGQACQPVYTGPMLRRLTIALLTLCLMLPAVAMDGMHNQAQAVPVMASVTHGHHHGESPISPADTLPQTQKHDCIGCVPQPGVPAMLQMRIAVGLVPLRQLRDLGRPTGNAAPEPPPPRT